MYRLCSFPASWEVSALFKAFSNWEERRLEWLTFSTNPSEAYCISIFALVEEATLDQIYIYVQAINTTKVLCLWSTFLIGISIKNSFSIKRETQNLTRVPSRIGRKHVIPLSTYSKSPEYFIKICQCLCDFPSHTGLLFLLQRFRLEYFLEQR